MSDDKMFSNTFRYDAFNEIKRIGAGVSCNLVGVVQNPMPLTDIELSVFNSQVDAYIERLKSVKDKINSEYSSDRLVPFNEEL